LWQVMTLSVRVLKGRHSYQPSHEHKLNCRHTFFRKPWGLIVRWSCDICKGTYTLWDDSKVKQRQQQVKKIKNNWAFALNYRNHKQKGRKNLLACTWRVLNNIAWATFNFFWNKTRWKSDPKIIHCRQGAIHCPEIHEN
jgi:hypothetical protein